MQNQFSNEPPRGGNMIIDCKYNHPCEYYYIIMRSWSSADVHIIRVQFLRTVKFAYTRRDSVL